VTALGRSLVLRFDGSVRFGPDNADPQAAAIGYVIEEAEPLVEWSQELSAFVSSTHVEFRALVAGVRAVAALMDHQRVSAVHVRGDAAAVIDTVDPSRTTAVDDGICRRRTERVRDALAPVPTVTYRHVRRYENERAHDLATRGYSRPSDT
jgi:ribonuclease HI